MKYDLSIHRPMIALSFLFDSFPHPVWKTNNVLLTIISHTKPHMGASCIHKTLTDGGYDCKSHSLLF